MSRLVGLGLKVFWVDWMVSPRVSFFVKKKFHFQDFNNPACGLEMIYDGLTKSVSLFLGKFYF